MTKEEYSQLNYLLAKLKYCYAEIAQDCINKNDFIDIIDKISDVQTGLIILKDKSKRQLEIGVENNEK